MAKKKQTEPKVVEVAPTPEPLEAGEVISGEKSQTILVGGVVYHHIREASNGQWIYAPFRSN